MPGLRLKISVTGRSIVYRTPLSSGKLGLTVIMSVHTMRFMLPQHASMMPPSLLQMVLFRDPPLLALWCKIYAWDSSKWEFLGQDKGDTSALCPPNQFQYGRLEPFFVKKMPVQKRGNSGRILKPCNLGNSVVILETHYLIHLDFIDKIK